MIYILLSLLYTLANRAMPEVYPSRIPVSTGPSPI